jgi:hypothetical protein
MTLETLPKFEHFEEGSQIADETLDHLETLFETGSLKSESLYSDLNARLNTLGKKLHSFRRSVEESHQSRK